MNLAPQPAQAAPAQPVPGASMARSALPMPAGPVAKAGPKPAPPVPPVPGAPVSTAPAPEIPAGEVDPAKVVVRHTLPDAVVTPLGPGGKPLVAGTKTEPVATTVLPLPGFGSAAVLLDALLTHVVLQSDEQVKNPPMRDLLVHRGLVVRVEKFNLITPKGLTVLVDLGIL